MNAHDDGFFYYDGRAPPFCLTQAPGQEADVDFALVNTCITQYLQDSHRYGLKSEFALLDCGLSAGEAGMLYFRNLVRNKAAQRRLNAAVDVNRVYEHVRQLFLQHMGMDVISPELRGAFRECLPARHILSVNYRREIMVCLKRFLTLVDLKTKGYTSKLRAITRDAITFIESTR